ncbi:MAG: hypothetical protein ACKPKO_24170, partial [Candidatus Fonsibacter sp.]
PGCPTATGIHGPENEHSNQYQSERLARAFQGTQQGLHLPSIHVVPNQDNTPMEVLSATL